MANVRTCQVDMYCHCLIFCFCFPGNAHFKGERYWKNNDTAAILIYDVNGYIAGIQAGVGDVGEKFKEVNKIKLDMSRDMTKPTK